MNDLSPTEIEALARAIGQTPPPSEHISPEPAFENKKEKKSIPIETVKSGISRAQFTQLNEKSSQSSPSIEAELQHIKLHIEVVLGRSKISLENLLKLQIGHVIPLDKWAGEPVEILANGKKIALGEVVVTEEENFGVKILEFINNPS